MGKWYCVQHYYDSGKVDAYITDKKEELPNQAVTHQKSADIYVDEFDTLDEAEKFKRDALKA